MKWVKVAIGAVIAIAVVPMIALSVFNLTQEQVKEEVVTFEVLTSNTVTSGTFDILYNYEDDNIVSIELNNVLQPSPYISFSFTEISISNMNSNDFILVDDDTTISEGYTNKVGDVWVITFEVTQAPILSGITATLLLLAPVIFVSGVLYFIYNNKEEGI